MKNDNETAAPLGSATYSPEDNKIRMTFTDRLPPDLYARVRAAGYIWAPQQKIFVAPMWTPSREDLAVELCGEIGDEDKSLVERAAERADRFEDYSASRADDASRAHKAVESIAGGIPLGQPILVGHHSERRARKDAEKIESGMRRAVKMWETSQYWADRAAGAIRSAKYKELPAVRARRIKGLEADKRKQERILEEFDHVGKFWRGELHLINRATGEKRPFDLTYENVIRFTGSDSSHMSFEFPVAKYPRTTPASQYEGRMSLYSALGGGDGQDYAVITIEQARDLALKYCAAVAENHVRWLAHYENRIAYEKAMLAESGGLVTQRQPIGVGGQVLRRGKWFVVCKLNMRNGELSSVGVSGHWAATISADEIQDYRPPAEGDFEKVKAVMETKPLCNYPGEKFATMTQAEWDKAPKDYKVSGGRRGVIVATEKAGSHRVRMILGVYATLPPESDEEKRKPFYCASNHSHKYWPIFITDAKVKLPPSPDGKPAPKLPALIPSEPFAGGYKAPAKTEFDAMKETLAAGVQVVSAPQLFPTPPDLARKMTDAAGIVAGRRILEPSAGTGNLIRAALNAATGADCCKIVAVEINPSLARGLEDQRNKTVYANENNFDVRCADFLECNGNLGLFDLVLMNPPFANGDDIKHIEHARHFLKPGGKIVAICANGPRQQAALKPIAATWEDLPAGTFASSGTNVNTALLTIEN